MFQTISDSLNFHTSTQVVDSVSMHIANKENIFGELLHHIHDSRIIEIPFGHFELPQFPPVNIGGIEIDFSITKHVLFLCAIRFFGSTGAQNLSLHSHHEAPEQSTT